MKAYVKSGSGGARLIPPNSTTICEISVPFRLNQTKWCCCTIVEFHLPTVTQLSQILEDTPFLTLYSDSRYPTMSIIFSTSYGVTAEVSSEKHHMTFLFNLFAVFVKIKASGACGGRLPPINWYEFLIEKNIFN